MNRKFETLEELEAFLLEKNAGGVSETLTKELRQTKEENKKLVEENSLILLESASKDNRINQVENDMANLLLNMAGGTL